MMSTKFMTIPEYDEHPKQCPGCNNPFGQSEEPIKSGYHHGDGQWRLCCYNCGFIRYDVRNDSDCIKNTHKNE